MLGDVIVALIGDRCSDSLRLCLDSVKGVAKKLVLLELSVFHLLVPFIYGTPSMT